MVISTTEVAFRKAKRLENLPAYLFVELDQKKQEAIRGKTPLIDLSLGDPDLPPPGGVLKAFEDALKYPMNHRYPSTLGHLNLRKGIAGWMERRFGAFLDPETEILPLLGSKEGLGHLPLACLNSGDIALIPDPAYPAYQEAVILAGGVPYRVPLREEDQFLPDFSKIPSTVLKKAKLIYLNYPNNPTTAVASLKFFKTAVSFAQKHHLLVAHDLAYSEIYFHQPPPSFLRGEGGKSVGIEFHSFSKTFSIPGWRIGWACGQRQAIAALRRVKETYDSGIFLAIQEAVCASFNIGDSAVEQIRNTYRFRRDFFVSHLRELDWQVVEPEATFYVWAKPPKSLSKKASRDVVMRLFEKSKVLCAPGNGFGAMGEGYVRFSLTSPELVLREAVKRIGSLP